MCYVIKILSCSTSIDVVDPHTPCLGIFISRSCFVSEEVRNITTQSILSSVGEQYGIQVGKTPNFFLVTWVHYKNYRDISNFLIMTFTFTIERICISTCILNYDVNIVACLHEFIRSCQSSIFINSDEFNYLIFIYQCSDRKF